MENETIKKLDDIVMFREQIASAIANLVGEETVISDTSITKVIDTLIPVIEKAASLGYDVGRIHQVNGGNKQEFLQKYFAKTTKTEDIVNLP